MNDELTNVDVLGTVLDDGPSRRFAGPLENLDGMCLPLTTKEFVLQRLVPGPNWRSLTSRYAFVVSITSKVGVVEIGAAPFEHKANLCDQAHRSGTDFGGGILWSVPRGPPFAPRVQNMFVAPSTRLPRRIDGSGSAGELAMGNRTRAP